MNGVNKTKGIEQSTVERHGKNVGRKGSGGSGFFSLEWKVRLSFLNFLFFRMHETLW